MSLHKIGGDFAVMTLLYFKKLALDRMEDKKWTQLMIIGIPHHSYYINITHYNGKFYAINKSRLTISVDPVSLKITKVAPALPSPNLHYLVASFGDLFLVSYCYNLSEPEDGNFFELRVYKLNEEKREWLAVDRLKDHALFIDDDGFFSISIKDFTGCEGNSVDFGNNEFSNANDDYRMWFARNF